MKVPFNDKDTFRDLSRGMVIFVFFIINSLEPLLRRSNPCKAGASGRARWREIPQVLDPSIQATFCVSFELKR
jgi:hypothetical protein